MHLGCLHNLAIVNSAVINIVVQGSLLYPDLCSSGYMHRSGVTGSHGSYIFSFLRNLHTDFHNDCTNLHSPKECISVPLSLHPFQHLLLFLLLKMAILSGVRWNLNVVLIYLSLLAREVEHFCIYWPHEPLPLKISYSINVPFLHWDVACLRLSFLSFL
jgi:hypothetical protein